jgi:uncharacterized repeat protein (TIGR01451 family)
MKSLSRFNSRMAIFALALNLALLVSAQDFSLTMQPSTVTLIPGQNSSFVITMTPLNGFTSEVSLAVGTLPSGVTAQFSPASLTPPGTSLLELSATTNATLGTFTLNVTATGGGVTNTTSTTVTVNFGLLPTCYGAFQGKVTDNVSGAPVVGATVTASYTYQNYAVTDTNGVFIFTNLVLAGADNQPANYSFTINSTNYWPPPYTTAYAVCDATNVVNFQLLKKETGSLSGHVVAQGGGPLSGVQVAVNGIQYTTTDTNGLYLFAALPLNSGNAPANYEVYTTISGYWQSSSNVLIEANSNAVVNFTIVPMCTATVQGKVILADSGLPAVNSSVIISGGQGIGTYVTTDSSGNYTSTNVNLGFDNAPTTTSVQASYTGYYISYTNSPLSTCGETLAMPTLVLQPIPKIVNNYGSIAGHVYDVQTGQPITNAYVYNYNDSGYTDTNGAYLLTNILVGSGSTTSGVSSITVSSSAYFSAASNLTVYANEVVTQDVRLLLIGHGVIVGTVRDSLSTLPLDGVYVSISGSGGQYTDPNGHYGSGPLPLSSGNVPTYEYLSFSSNGYWTTYSNTSITLGATNVIDVNLLKVCTGATIVGNIVDALTQKPITNASVSVSGTVYRYAATDTNGNFTLTNITVGDANSPIENTITASAPGYNSQTKTVTIFCNATIITEFGAPQTVFGGIAGRVTNVLTGLPLTNVFIGSGFGAATYTDTNGDYSFSQVPLGANGASRVWTVTAAPDGFPQQTESVSVSSNTVSQLDFGFGQAPTALMVTATASPDPDVVGSNLLFLVVLTNTVADALQVQLSDALPPGVTFISAAITNSPGTPFSAPVYSNNIVTTTAANFGSNSAVSLAILVTPTVTGTLTNVAAVTSATPDLDPTLSNHTATVTAPVLGPPTADLALLLTENLSSIVIGSNVIYTLVVTNLGPADAPDVVLDDTLPAGAAYVSSTSSQGSATNTNAGTVHWDFGALANAGFATATLVVTPSTTGMITNSGAVTLAPKGVSVSDTNLANNSASIVATVTAATNSPPPTNVAVQALGPITFNPQTGLYQQPVLFTNLSGVDASAVRVAVLGLPSSVVLYNAAGSTNGAPYVEYDQAVPAGGGVVLLLEYYEATRETFDSTNFVATAVAAKTPSAPTGTVLKLDSNGYFVSQGQLTIEFATVPGKTYVVQYSTNVTSGQWQTAVPPIVANDTKTQWIDAGPPKTDSPPGVPSLRYYRVVQTN